MEVSTSVEMSLIEYGRRGICTNEGTALKISTRHMNLQQSIASWSQ